VLARALPLLALVVILATSAYGCLDECAQEACDAARVPRGGDAVEQGVTGVVASKSDVCEDGCCACSWAQAELNVWRSDAPVDLAQGLLLVQREPDATITADRSYTLALEPGHHMLCLRDTCARLELARGELFTVNVQLRYGPPSLLVFGPGDDDPRDDLVFSVNRE